MVAILRRAGLWKQLERGAFFKDVKDYEVLEFIIRDTEYSPNCDAYREFEKRP